MSEIKFKIIERKGDIYTITTLPPLSDEEYLQMFDTISRQFIVFDCSQNDQAAYAFVPTDYQHLVYTNKRGCEAFAAAYQDYNEPFRIYQNVTSLRDYRFYRSGEDCKDNEWKLLGWYHPHQKRMAFPPYVALHELLSQPDADYVSHTAMILVKKVS